MPVFQTNVTANEGKLTKFMIIYDISLKNCGKVNSVNLLKPLFSYVNH